MREGLGDVRDLRNLREIAEIVDIIIIGIGEEVDLEKIVENIETKIDTIESQDATEMMMITIEEGADLQATSKNVDLDLPHHHHQAHQLPATVALLRSQVTWKMRGKRLKWRKLEL